MKYFRNKEDSLKLGLSLFLLAGSALGTLFCNGMTGEMKQELMSFGQSSATQAMLSGVDRYDLFLQILPKRVWALIMIMLAAATPVANWCMRFIAGYMGFSNAVIICALTMESGVRGLFRYFLLVFPQCICYILIDFLVMWWMPANEKMLTPLSVVLLFCLAAVGGGMESFANPWFLKWF